MLIKYTEMSHQGCVTLTIFSVYVPITCLFQMLSLGAGSFCPLPFVFNRGYYDTCTRQKVDGTPNNVEEFYWCPSPEDVNKGENNLFQPNGKYGKCHDYLKPPGIAEQYLILILTLNLII